MEGEAMSENVRHYAIYALFDPLDPDAIRYIGYAHNVKKRLNRHLLRAVRSLDPTHKERWICKLIDEERLPSFRILEFLDCCRGDKLLAEREQYWIRHARENNHDLTNATDGGEGWSNPSEETRRRISAALKDKPKTAAHRAAVVAARRARNNYAHTQTTRDKLAAAQRGKTLSEETKRKMSAVQKGRKHGPMPLEQRQKLSDAAYAYWARHRE